MILFFILFFAWLFVFLCTLFAAWVWGSDAAAEYRALPNPGIISAQTGNRSPPK